MRVLIVGDVHGNIRHFAELVDHAKHQLGIEAVIQVGDFGFYPGFMRSKTARFAVPVYAIDGNHENHRWLRLSNSRSWPKKHNLTYQDRGTVRTFGSRRVGFLGGALNVDRPQTGLSDRHEANWIREIDVHTAMQKFGKKPLDLVVTHTCPSHIGIGMRGAPMFKLGVELFVRSAGFNPGPDDDVGDEMLSLLWDEIPKPPLWVFGHFHQHRTVKIGETEFHCVGTGDGNQVFKPVVWDSETGILEHS